MTLDDPRRDPAEPPREPGSDVAGARQPAAWRAGEASGWPNLDETGPDGVAEPVRRPRVRNRAVLGIIAFTLAALLLIANIVGTVMANSGAAREVTLGIAFAAIFGSILTFLAGLIAAVFNFGRGWGVAAMGLSVLANPLVLVVLFGLFTGALRP